jgi:hypothetical protein
MESVYNLMFYETPTVHRIIETVDNLQPRIVVYETPTSHCIIETVDYLKPHIMCYHKSISVLQIACN